MLSNQASWADIPADDRGAFLDDFEALADKALEAVQSLKIELEANYLENSDTYADACKLGREVNELMEKWL